MTEQEAYAFVEARLWPTGPVCPKCKYIGNSVKLQGSSTRLGVRKCRHCRKPFRVTVGTPFERSHVALSLWLEALAMFRDAKVSVTCDRIESLGVSRKSAWQMQRRILDFSRYQPEAFQRLTG